MTVPDYATAGPFTDLATIPSYVLEGVDGSPVEVCRPVHSLVVQPVDAERLGLQAGRFATNQVRPAAALVEAVLALSPDPLVRPRGAEERIVGTCRHFAVLACALLRHRGVRARARCGFATYFQPGRAVDHWVVEYAGAADGRWVRVDPEILGDDVLDRADDLQPADFLTGAEAWIAYRAGNLDPLTCGVYGTDHWGWAEIAGNVVRDLAALNRVEMLPWDEWGRMADAYADRTGPGYATFLDDVAEAVIADDPTVLASLYAHEDLAVPRSLQS